MPATLDVPPEVAEQMEAMKAEIAGLRGELQKAKAAAEAKPATPDPAVDALKAENTALKNHAALARALGRRLPAEAASDCAKLLSGEVKVLADGTVMHKELGVGVEDIARNYLEGEGNYWLRSAAAQQGTGATAATSGWNIERAKVDKAYLEQWKSADPDGFQHAWNEMLAATVKNLKVGKPA